MNNYQSLIVKVGSTSIHKVNPVRSAFRDMVPNQTLVIGEPADTGYLRCHTA
jgi:hypothetical protein